MQVFIAALIGGLYTVLGSFVGQILLSLGIGFATYTGVDAALESVKGLVVTHISAGPAKFLGILGLLKVDSFIVLMFSAMVAKLTMNGLASGSIKRMIWK